MNPAHKTYNRTEKEKLIWKHKHPDYKGVNEYGRSIMLPANMHQEYGQMANLSHIDEKGLGVLFEDALQAEARAVKRNIFIHVLDGKYPHLDDAAANQWSSTFDDMRQFAQGVEMSNANKERALEQIDQFEKKFNNAPEKIVEKAHEGPTIER